MFNDEWRRLKLRIEGLIDDHNNRIALKINEIKKELHYKAPTSRPPLSTKFGILMATVEAFQVFFYSFWLMTPNEIDSGTIMTAYIFLLVGTLLIELGYFATILITFINFTPKDIGLLNSTELLESRIAQSSDTDSWGN
jgi:uncharacterized membrane protein